MPTPTNSRAHEQGATYTITSPDDVCDHGECVGYIANAVTGATIAHYRDGYRIAIGVPLCMGCDAPVTGDECPNCDVPATAEQLARFYGNGPYAEMARALASTPAPMDAVLSAYLGSVRGSSWFDRVFVDARDAA